MIYTTKKQIALKRVDSPAHKVFPVGSRLLVVPPEESGVLGGAKIDNGSEIVKMEGDDTEYILFPKDTHKKDVKVNQIGTNKFEERFCQALIDWFKVEPNYLKELTHYGKDGSVSWRDYKSFTNKLPTFYGFASSIGVNVSTVRGWASEENKKRCPGFAEAYEEAKEAQKDFIIQNGLIGAYNPAFAIFVAKNITDMKDTVDNTVLLNGNISLAALFDQTEKKKKGK